MKIITPVRDRLVTRHPEWSALTKHDIVIDYLRNSGALGGTGSLDTGYNLLQLYLVNSELPNTGTVSSNTCVDLLHLFKYSNI